jgi:ring-1,2-phenylacetyl-CoA epoxidase subunit PaaE
MTVTTRRPSRRRPLFHPLTVTAVDRLTDDAVMVSFAVPEHLRETFAFSPGQHLTVRLGTVNLGAVDPDTVDPGTVDPDTVDAGIVNAGTLDPGTVKPGTVKPGDNQADDVRDSGEVRRSYSICSTPGEVAHRGVLRIGVREIVGGTFSGYAMTGLRGGDTLDVLPPLGRFTTPLDPKRARHYGAIVAGSGITPVLSLVATALATEPDSRFTVLYGNRRAGTVMFAEDLADLKDRYPHRLHLIHVLSRELQLSAMLSGRLDAQRLRHILDSGLVDPVSVDEWFLCGPYGMVVDAQAVLAEHAVPDRAVRSELFHVEDVPVRADADVDRTRPGPAPAALTTTVNPTVTTNVTILLDGRESTATMARDERVLDAALKIRAELPYACKGGVCSTCRAKVVEGEVAMVRNYALEPDEVAAGYVLTCQSVPLTQRLVVDYDA